MKPENEDRDIQQSSSTKGYYGKGVVCCVDGIDKSSGGSGQCLYRNMTPRQYGYAKYQPRPVSKGATNFDAISALQNLSYRGWHFI